MLSYFFVRSAMCRLWHPMCDSISPPVLLQAWCSPASDQSGKGFRAGWFWVTKVAQQRPPLIDLASSAGIPSWSAQCRRFSRDKEFGPVHSGTWWVPLSVVCSRKACIGKKNAFRIGDLYIKAVADLHTANYITVHHTGFFSYNPSDFKYSGVV